MIDVAAEIKSAVSIPVGAATYMDPAQAPDYFEAAIAEGNKRQALAYYDDLILLKEPPMRILFLIVRQYRILLLIANMRGLHKPDKDIAQAAGIPVFAIRKNAAQLRGYTMSSLEHCIASCMQIEEEVKTGRIGDQIGLETLIVGLSERIGI